MTHSKGFGRKWSWCNWGIILESRCRNWETPPKTSQDIWCPGQYTNWTTSMLPV